MNRTQFAIVLVAALGLSLPSRASAQNLDAQRSQINAALIAAEKGQPIAPGLEKHPLYGWVELATLRRNIDTLSTAQAQSFLKRYEGQAVADALRASLWDGGQWIADYRRLRVVAVKH